MAILKVKKDGSHKNTNLVEIKHRMFVKKLIFLYILGFLNLSLTIYNLIRR